jgi:hypothetical protein
VKKSNITTNHQEEKAMGTWGIEPWANDAAADWFADFFDGLEVDQKIDIALRYPDDHDKIRAACYILGALGRTYIWPGDLDKLDEHLQKGTDLLKGMLDPENHDSDFLELWEGDEEAIESVTCQINTLEQRLARR